MSLTTLLLLTGFLFFMAVALTAVLLAARNADEGYEDDVGYHSGRLRPASARPVKPMVSDRLKIMLMPDVPISSLILPPGGSPRPPRMGASRAEIELTPATVLVPLNSPISMLKQPLASGDAAVPKRKRRASARKDGPPDGNQLGFPGFAA